MRVVAGNLRGRVLHSPRSHSYRPTTDRVKESVFNILDNLIDWEGLHIGDLFAGSGALGIEALSRGAATANFVENDRQSLAILRRNIDELALHDKAHINATSVRSFLAYTVRRFDLIFADPPYAYQEYDALFGMIATKQLLSSRGMLIVEHHTKTILPATEPWERTDTRSYGTTMMTFCRFTVPQPAQIAL